MKNRILAFVTILVVFLLLDMAIHKQAQAEAGKRWQYLVLTKANDFHDCPNNWQDCINELGKQGWELVAVDNDKVYFKK